LQTHGRLSVLQIFPIPHLKPRQINGLSSAEPTLRASFAAVPHFSSSLRQSIAEQAVRPLFTRIPAQRLQAWLGFSSAAEVEAFAQETLGWKADGEGFAVPPIVSSSADEAAPVQVSQGGLTIDSAWRSLSLPAKADSRVFAQNWASCSSSRRTQQARGVRSRQLHRFFGLATQRAKACPFLARRVSPEIWLVCVQPL
jgi:hypothetical protein